MTHLIDSTMTPLPLAATIRGPPSIYEGLICKITSTYSLLLVQM